MKRILDVTCGNRTIWFQKQEPHTIYCDIRNEEWEGDFGKVLNKHGKKKHLLDFWQYSQLAQKVCCCMAETGV